MQINPIQSSVTDTEADVLLVGAFEDAPLSGAAAEVDAGLNKAISSLLERREFTGRAYELASLLVPFGKARQVLVVGLGRKDKFDVGAAFRTAGAAANALAAKPRARVAFFLDQSWPAEWTEAGVCGAMVGCQGQDLYRAEKSRHPLTTILWAGGTDRALGNGRILGDAVSLTRRLVNEPADVIYPETFATQASQVAHQNGIEIDIWDEKRLDSERCGSLLAVAKGSNRPARLVMLRYRGASKDASTLAIVGKGVTFDSGGLSLKTPDGMLTMKCDMAGASTMLGAMQAIAQLKLPINVLGLAGLVENMTGPAAMKLGDVLKARNGRTIEVHNTDAEGRLVLADVLAVAVDEKVAKIVDLATLTGACVVALGTEVAGAMTNDQAWCDSVLTAARHVGEPIWQLPMYPEIYDEQIKSPVADIKNVGDGRWGGAITAAKFLEQFVAGTPWTHLDIAGPAFRDKAKPWCDAGASGQFVRTLVQLAREWESIEMPWISESAPEISWPRLEKLMHQTVAEARRRICAHPKRVLLLPPDITRAHSGVGRLTEMLYQELSVAAEVHVIPTLGQHVPHTPDENRRMFGSIPEERIHAHDWRGGCVHVGEVSADYVKQACGGVADWPIPVYLNRMLMEEKWDLVINIGHVVPHEVLGFANHNKNYFIGLGGKETICASHMLAATCGIENNLGNLITPTRACFNKAEDDLLARLPDLYVQVVMARNPQQELVHTGVFVGDDLETYLQAARQSREQNITVFEQPVQKMVCVMQADEFVSTWVANKAVYRTRMALADGGELIIIAPGLKRFGEQPEVDQFIRKYGYCGTPRVVAGYRVHADMQDLGHATAHLIHGSSEGRFTITYAPGFLTAAEVEGVNFRYADLESTLARYQPDSRQEGWHTLPDGERFFFIPTPSSGLWATRDKLYGRAGGFDRS